MLPKKPNPDFSFAPTSHSGIRASASGQKPSGDIHSRRAVHLLFGHVSEIPHYHVAELFIRDGVYHVSFNHLCVRTELKLDLFSGDQLDEKLRVGVSDVFDYKDDLNRSAMARLLIYATKEQASNELSRQTRQLTEV